MSLITRERGAYTRGSLHSGWFIFGWKNALLIWGANIRESLYTGEGGGRGCLFTEFCGSTKTMLVLILKYLAQETNANSKSAAENVKKVVKSVKS